jgi:hypothetical protein
MAEKPIGFETITKLVRDPIIVRVVTVLDITSLSILEVLEYGLTIQDVNHALVSDVIQIDKATLPRAEIVSFEDLLVAGEIYYYQFLNSKVRLTELGNYLLECIKGSQTEQEIIEKAGERFALGKFSPPEHPQRSGQYPGHG